MSVAIKVTDRHMVVEMSQLRQSNLLVVEVLVVAFERIQEIEHRSDQREVDDRSDETENADVAQILEEKLLPHVETCSHNDRRQQIVEDDVR